MTFFKSIPLFLLFINCSIFAAEQSSSPDVEIEGAELQKEAKQKIKSFAKTLKATLGAAIKAGDLSSGVEVCSKQAPIIAESLSTNGWQLSRTSFKPRNTKNMPNAWQVSVLDAFEKQKADGKPVSEIAFSTHQGNQFQFVKAIPTSELCLKCHGKNIEPSLRATINNLYPNDQATGFSLGDIRGAFVVQKTVSKN